MRRWVVLLAGLVLAGPARGAAGADGAPGEPELTVQAAIDAALRTSPRLEMARAGIDRAEGDRRRATSELFPRLGVAASYLRTIRSEYETTFEPAQSGPDGMPGPPPPSNPFLVPNTYRVGLTASETLYAGGRISAGIELADAGRQVAAIDAGTMRAQVVLDAADAYYAAVLADQLVESAAAALHRAEETLEGARLGRGLGAKPEFDVLRAEVALKNQRAVVEQARLDQHLAHLRLAQLIGAPLDRSLRLASAIDVERAGEVARFAANAAGIATVDREVVRAAEETVRMREAGVAIARAGHLPTLQLSSDAGYAAFSTTLGPSSDELHPYWTVGLFLQIPIFCGLCVVGEVDAREADVVEATARLDLTRQLARLDTESTRVRLAGARAALAATEGARDEARRAYELATLRLKNGVSSVLEVADTRYQLEQAEVHRARAARDLEVAEIRIALLPALPIGQTGPGPALQIPMQGPSPEAASGNATRAAAAGGPASQATPLLKY